MPWQPNFRKGVDLPVWDWMSFSPVQSRPGTANAYDGNRYIYWAIQSGSDTTAGTTQIYRFDTWTEGWQYIVNTTNSFSGVDLEYDPVRNVLYVIHGNGLTSWQVFNLNTTAVTVFNVSVAAWALATIAPVLPAVANAASSLTFIDDLSVPATLDTAFVAPTGSTATTIVQDPSAGIYRTFGAGLIGQQVRFTSGALSGQSRLISAVPGVNTLTVNGFGAAPAPGDTFVIELPSATATGGTTTTVTTGQAMAVNLYANSDVVILSGTGAGQRRRIASNDAAGVLTLAAAYTAPATNPRVGPFTTAPDATSVFRIVPSSDFIYYQNGGGTGLYRIDIAQTGSAPTWSTMASLPAATGGGGNTMSPQAYDPFGIIALRGAATATVYRYSIGGNSWTTLTTFPGSETFTTGASTALIHGRRRMFIQKEGSTRTYLLDLTTGMLEPGPFVPYANPGAHDGKRSRFVKSADGVEWLYHLRAGGQEFYRVPLEWLV